MIDDDTIKRLEDLAHSANQEALSFGMGLDPFMRLARAVYALGRQAGLEEAAVTAWTQYMEACRKMHLPPSQWESFLVAPAIRTLKENKHDQ